MLVPRRYGGLEVDMETYMRVVLELARGCPSSAWCMCLAANHALQIGSWFEERAQDEIFGDGDFRCASVAAPIGSATRVTDGWQLDGQVAYASGAPYSTHYMGQALMPDDGVPAPPRMLLFVAPRSEWTMLDDWGDTLGLRGSGSHSVRFDGARIPEHWAIEDTMMVDVDVSGGTPGVGCTATRLRRACAGPVHDVAGRAVHRRGLQRARRARVPAALQARAAAAVPPAQSTIPTTSACSVRRWRGSACARRR